MLTQFTIRVCCCLSKIALGQGAKNYLEQPSNLMHFYVHFMIFFLCFTIYLELYTTTIVILNTLTMVILNIKAIYELRIFQSLRYLIAMIQAVFQDFMPFLVILTVFLTLFTNIDVYLSRLD